MAGKLFVHIGPAKTGTSAIQHALGGDQDAVLYPRTGQWWDKAHHNLAFNFLGEYRRPETERRDIDALFAAIAAEAAGDPRAIVVSSEALWGQDVEGFIARLLAYLGPREAEILVTCRAHAGLASSLYNQMVKDAFFGETRLPDDFLAQTAPMIAYRPVLERLAGGRYPVAAINYHPADSLVPRVLAHLGFANPPPGEKRNPSLSRKGLAAQLAANRVAADFEGRSRFGAAVEAMPGGMGSAGALFGAGVLETVMPAFARDAAWLRDAHGIVLPEPDVTAAARFGVDAGELDEIAAAFAPLGADGAAAADAARAFLC